MNSIKAISANLAKIPVSKKLTEFPLTQFETSTIEGIQRGIPLFENVSISNIAFITKRLETLNLFRGCKLGCSHCLKNAVAPKKGRESILFEDLLRFTNGFKELSERLGFNALNGNKYLNIIDDSNPIDLPIKGITRDHSVVEGMKLIYEKLHIPTLFVTSGWKQTGKYEQETAEELVRTVKKDPNSIEEVQVSINPFLNIKDYKDRMANTLSTFLDLFKIDKAKIILRHGTTEGIDEKATKKLYHDIYKKLQERTNSGLESLPQLKPDIVTEFDKNHLIEPSGRARQFFSYERNMKLQEELIQDSLDWGVMSKEEQRETLLNRALKCVDIDGTVYTTKPSSAEYVNTPIELTIPTDIKLNYINKEKPNPIFSDIGV